MTPLNMPIHPHEHSLDYSMHCLHRTVLLSVGTSEHCSWHRRSTSSEAYSCRGSTLPFPHGTHHNFWRPWVDINWLQMARIMEGIPPWLKPKSASVLLDKRKWVTHFCIRRVSRLDWEVMHSWQDADMRTSCSPNCARIFGVLYIVEPLCSTSLEAEAIYTGRHAPITRIFKSVPWGVEYAPPGYWMSDLGVIFKSIPWGIEYALPGFWVSDPGVIVTLY